MAEQKYLEVLTIEDLCHHTGATRTFVSRVVRLGIIEPISDDAPESFSPETILKINKVIRIRRDLNLSLSNMSFVLHLMERMHNLEERLKFFEMK